MTMRKTIIAAALTVLSGGQALAAVSADEAAKIGGELTPFGAIKAGNADGSIPAYAGGLTSPPAGFDPTTGNYVDPFPNDKPVLRIDAKNVDQYAAKLPAGAVHLIKNNASYAVNVYPTRRTSWYPDRVLQATKRNAVACKTLNGGLALDPSCRGGIPFPIPKNGYEVMWNKILNYTPPMEGRVQSYMIDSSGSVVLTSEIDSYSELSYYNDSRSDPSKYLTIYSKTVAPARKSGEATGYSDFLNPIDQPRRAWSYTPGQRRVKLAPEFSYDTPVSTTGGVMLYDEIFMFSGAMDRFDFKLVGKREVYLPANNFQLFSTTSKCADPAVELGPKHENPDCERWELRRAWVVEATLKPGMRHTYSKRVYYFDEDAPASGAFDAYDQSGSLYRSAFNYSIPLYATGGTYAARFVIYDFAKGMYATQSKPTGGFRAVEPKSERELAPEAIAGQGVR